MVVSYTKKSTVFYSTFSCHNTPSKLLANILVGVVRQFKHPLFKKAICMIQDDYIAFDVTWAFLIIENSQS